MKQQKDEACQKMDTESLESLLMARIDLLERHALGDTALLRKPSAVRDAMLVDPGDRREIRLRLSREGHARGARVEAGRHPASRG